MEGKKRREDEDPSFSHITINLDFLNIASYICKLQSFYFDSERTQRLSRRTVTEAHLSVYQVTRQKF